MGSLRKRNIRWGFIKQYTGVWHLTKNDKLLHTSTSKLKLLQYITEYTKKENKHVRS